MQSLAAALAGTRRRAHHTRARDALITLARLPRHSPPGPPLDAQRGQVQPRAAGGALRTLRAPASFTRAAVMARTWHARAERSCCKRAHAWSEVATGRLHGNRNGKRVRVVACDSRGLFA